jgi:glycosyltransferase involved in cell wall biosynthesis
MSSVNTEVAPRCCFLISSLAGGGAEGVCTTIASGLAEKGGDVELVVLNMHNSVYHDRLSQQVKLTVLGVSQARYAFLPLIRHLNRTKPDKLVVFNYELAVIMVLIRPFIPAKTQLIARNINTLSVSFSPTNNSLMLRLLQKLVRRLYSKVDLIINQCESMRQDLCSTTSVVLARTAVIYNPVSSRIEQLSQQQQQMPAASAPFILCAGRLQPQKAFDLAIKAFALASVQLPEYRLKIVGQGSLEQDLKALANTLQVADKVDFEGFQQNIVPYYQAATFTLLSSLYEGFPNVLVESITLGTPVVAVNCPSGPSEIVVPGVNGYLVESRNEVSLATSMVSAAQKQWDRQQVKRTAQRFSVEEIVTQWSNLLMSQGATA